ncbi:tripartite tricarboxylate transporter substrate-binding protein [Nocardiopsis sp. RSe5-2]|uniref:Tripartite tricarboxylate transporter substrate-binding protein n=1 Tax=Nocardiopsis endophytica TaxID=3018445 RepID=A0ABT4UDX6_9ACTN|nr:tripartite tricarboxylate transporter substrate-binding protein [Nocardiopsis endophytica]MDA2815204.1 tripartite tricarboxylate transporter substrate-binding protein [Nocardiopsis endophytica]
MPGGPRSPRPLLAAGAALVLCAAAALTALAVWGPEPRPPELRLMVPNPPGGGYDTTARAVAEALAADPGAAGAPEVFNLQGGAGTAALARTVHEEGNGHLMLQMGLGLVAGAQVRGSQYTPADTTPIARLLEEPEVVLVPADSPYTGFEQLAEDWRDPDTVLRLGGGSTRGGPDHLALLLIGEELGLEPGSLGYVRHDGGGDALAALLRHEVDVAAAGAGEYRHAIAAGELRPLAVTGAERVPGIDAPTLRELGLDLEFTNWRGLVAPPGIGDARRRELTGMLAGMRTSPQWRKALEENHWTDAYLEGDRFGEFLEDEQESVQDLLERQGLD